MAVAVTTLVWNHKPRIGALNRFVLLSLADHYNHELGYAFPSVERIMEHTELGERTVRRALAYLADCGLIISDRGGVRGRVCHYTPNFEALKAGLLRGAPAAPVPEGPKEGACQAKRGACQAKPPHPLKGVTVREPLGKEPLAESQQSTLASPPDFGEYLPLDLPAKEPLPAKEAANDAMLFPQEGLVSPSTAPSTALVPVAVPLLKLEELDSRALLGTFPCVGTRKTWGYTQRDQYEWELAFPGIDVAQELRSMWIWCKSNPKLIKTYNGMPRFIAAWLTKAQNSIGGKYGTAALQRTRSSGNFSVAEERIRKQQDQEGGHRPGPHVHQSRV